MRILFVTPYPPSCYRVRSYGFLTQLRRNHEVTIMALCRSAKELAEAEVLRNQGFDVEAVYEPKQQAILRSGMALMTSNSLHVAYAQSVRFTSAIQCVCSSRQFDVVHVEHLRGIAAVEPLAPIYPLVWDAVDCISLLYKQASISGPNLPLRAVAQLDHQRTQRFEGKVMKKLRNILVTSERDRKALLDLSYLQPESIIDEQSSSEPTFTVLPNGVDLDYFRPSRQERQRMNIVFSGKMNYHPNVATALYLYQQIMPIIWKSRPEVTLTLVGGEPPKIIRRLASDPRVKVTGFVEDMRPYIERAELMLCPMVYGTGIQNKVLEAMAIGTPVVVAVQSAEALAARPGRDLLTASTAQEFAEAALHLLEDANLRETLSHHGRMYVERHHNWQSVTERLLSVYQQAIDSPVKNESLVSVRV